MEISKENLSYKQLVTIAHAWCIDNPGKYGRVRLSDAKTGTKVWHTQIGATHNGLLSHTGRSNLDKAVARIQYRTGNPGTRFDVIIKLDWTQSSIVDDYEGVEVIGK